MTGEKGTTTKTEFPLAPWSKSVWIITLLATGFLLALIGWFLHLGIANGSRPGSAAAAFAIAGIALVLLLLLLVFAPSKYVLTPTDLIVWRLGPKVHIGLDEIESVEPLADRSGLHGVIRVLGDGGAFGYYGLFYNRKLGAFRAYVTRTDSLVLIRRKNHDPVLLSPRDPAAFIEQINKARA